MKIISELRDYYDLAGQGISKESPVYGRKNLPLPEDREIHNGNVIIPDWVHDDYVENYFPELQIPVPDPIYGHYHEHLTDFFLIICGKCFPLIQENRIAKGIFYNKCSKFPKNSEYREPFVVFTKERHISLLDKDWKPSDSIPYLDETIGKENSFLIELSKRVGLPVFICQTPAINRDLERRFIFEATEAVIWQEPPLLSSLRLEDVYPAEQLYNDISEFIEKVLTTK